MSACLSKEPLIGGGISQVASFPDGHNLFKSHSYARGLPLWPAGEAAFQCHLFVISFISTTSSMAGFTLPPSLHGELKVSSLQNHSVVLLQKLWKGPRVHRASPSFSHPSPQHTLLPKSSNCFMCGKHTASFSVLTCYLETGQPCLMLWGKWVWRKRWSADHWELSEDSWV